MSVPSILTGVPFMYCDTLGISVNGGVAVYCCCETADEVITSPDTGPGMCTDVWNRLFT
ncbi:hypothetical protein DPMN_052307 [Dreissena polymorpha]|uniref:Uncharacterized protein n=1 Tax=Dreissena polymorpha TaxID=45954 RepID=A0A9D4CLI3_DREPO|nr:hypothetical protein DPMN_052307 [Dreissena polymorpha]